MFLLVVVIFGLLIKVEVLWLFEIAGWAVLIGRFEGSIRNNFKDFGAFEVVGDVLIDSDAVLGLLPERLPYFHYVHEGLLDAQPRLDGAQPVRQLQLGHALPVGGRHLTRLHHQVLSGGVRDGQHVGDSVWS